MSGQKDSIAAEAIENAAQPATSNFTMTEKIHDGDDALQFLQQGQEPYDKQEEKRVLRKIDFRMVTLMLITNGFQFIDKNVRTPHQRSRCARVDVSQQVARFLCLVAC